MVPSATGHPKQPTCSRSRPLHAGGALLSPCLGTGQTPTAAIFEHRSPPGIGAKSDDLWGNLFLWLFFLNMASHCRVALRKAFHTARAIVMHRGALPEFTCQYAETAAGWLSDRAHLTSVHISDIKHALAKIQQEVWGQDNLRSLA